MTELRSGSAAAAVRCEARLDACLTRLLEALQPAAAAMRRGGLAALSAAAAARLIARMPPDVREGVIEDLGRYVHLCGRLKREKPELPHAYAAALLHLAAPPQRGAKRRGAAGGTAAGDDSNAGDGGSDATDRDELAEKGADNAADAARNKLQLELEVCELRETFSGAIRLAAGGGGAPLPSRRIPQVSRRSTCIFVVVYRAGTMRMQ